MVCIFTVLTIMFNTCFHWKFEIFYKASQNRLGYARSSELSFELFKFGESIIVAVINSSHSV